MYRQFILYRQRDIRDLNGEEIIEMFYKKELQKANQIEFRVEKVIKRKDDNLHFKSKDFDNLLNCWITKKIYDNVDEFFFPEPFRHTFKKVRIEL